MALIDRVAGDRPLAANIRQDIVERADGIPLFVEEMTKAVLEAEGEGAAARTVAAVPSPALAVPASLHASLTARLDRLGSAKGVAQIGAAIGREFSHPLLAFVAGLPEPDLAAALDRLAGAGLLFRQGFPPHATYLFKHALVQDAAYGALLREPRRALHARIAEVLESEFADIAESQPELLARHSTEAGMIEKAAHLWGKAGQRSLDRSALIEAEAQLARALAQIASLPGTPALRREAIKLQVALLNAQMHAKGYGAPDTKASLDQARSLIEGAEALGEPPEDPLALFSVLYGFWVANYIASNGGALRELAAQFLALAEKQGATIPLMIGHRLMGLSSLTAGRLRRGASAFRSRVCALRAPAAPCAGHAIWSRHRGGDRVLAGVDRFGRLAIPRAAREDAKHALRDAREIGHAATLLFALTVTWLTKLFCGDYGDAKAQADEAVALGDEKGALFWKGVGMMFKACVSALARRNRHGAVRRSRPRSRSSGQREHRSCFHSFNLAWLARMRHRDNSTTPGNGSTEAIVVVETSGERWCEAEVHRTAGEIALMSSEPDAAKAQTHFERALEIARAQQARSWELRAATSLARLWRDQGRRTEARDLLAPVYGWFTEGFDTLDLKEAKALLDNLA